MKNVHLLCISVIFYAQVKSDFDLKIYERSLKSEIPWSLTGSAQDLRSDAKNDLQLILRNIIFLRPDVPWSQEEKPSIEKIDENFKDLQSYLDREQSAEKQKWVLDSLDYILSTYIPEVQKLLDSSKKEDNNPLLEQKKELLKQFAQHIAAKKEELRSKTYSKNVMTNAAGSVQVVKSDNA